MPKIKEEGTYLVEIYGAHYIETKNGLAAVLPGKTIEGDWIEAYQTINEQILTKGKNQGMSWAEITMELLRTLGIGDDPNDIEKVNGAPAQFVVEEDLYNGKRTLKVRYVNPPSKTAADKDTVSNFFSSLGLSSTKSMKTETIVSEVTIAEPTDGPQEPEDPDDIPF